MPKKKKPKAVVVDGIPIKPISPAEHMRLGQANQEEVRKAAATVSDWLNATLLSGRPR
jgi:hypothetical protein